MMSLTTYYDYYYYYCRFLRKLVEGASCVGGQAKEWMGCFLGDL